MVTSTLGCNYLMVGFDILFTSKQGSILIVLGSERRQLANTLNQISFIEIAAGAVRCKEGREWSFENASWYSMDLLNLCALHGTGYFVCIIWPDSR